MLLKIYYIALLRNNCIPRWSLVHLWHLSRLSWLLSKSNIECKINFILYSGIKWFGNNNFILKINNFFGYQKLFWEPLTRCNLLWQVFEYKLHHCPALGEGWGRVVGCWGMVGKGWEGLGEVTRAGSFRFYRVRYPVTV